MPGIFDLIPISVTQNKKDIYIIAKKVFKTIEDTDYIKMDIICNTIVTIMGHEDFLPVNSPQKEYYDLNILRDKLESVIEVKKKCAKILSTDKRKLHLEELLKAN